MNIGARERKSHETFAKTTARNDAPRGTSGAARPFATNAEDAKDDSWEPARATAAREVSGPYHTGRKLALIAAATKIRQRDELHCRSAAPKSMMLLV